MLDALDALDGGVTGAALRAAKDELRDALAEDSNVVPFTGESIAA